MTLITISRSKLLEVDLLIFIFTINLILHNYIQNIVTYYLNIGHILLYIKLIILECT